MTWLFPVIAGVVLGFTCSAKKPGPNVRQVDRFPNLYPSYNGIVIPPNIAPLNFLVLEPGHRFQVKISSQTGPSILLSGSNPHILIPQKKWTRLLSSNKNHPLYIEVFVLDSTGWNRFSTITDTIAPDTIDPFLVYRRINISVRWMNMGIFQRNVGSFSESPIITSKDITGACMNCHNFRCNDPATMLLQLRSKTWGTPMYLRQSSDGILHAISLKTGMSHGKAGFTAWHPKKNIIAFSLNGFTMLYHTAAAEVRDVFDRNGDIALFDVGSNTISSVEAIASEGRIETMPAWSPKGDYLYYCSGPRVARDSANQLRCDLMGISYDYENNVWGTVDTVLTAFEAGGSITQPRISPDGRYIAVSISPYSDFPVHQAVSHIALISTQSSVVSVLDTGTFCDSWHGWSTNGRWLVFSSKRMDGRFSRPFFRYIDSAGIAHTPFVLPQKNPAYYRSQLHAFNIPELVGGKVKIPREDFLNALTGIDKREAADAATGATKSSGAAIPGEAE